MEEKEERELTIQSKTLINGRKKRGLTIQSKTIHKCDSCEKEEEEGGGGEREGGVSEWGS